MARDETVAGDEPVTSPDQRKALNHKWARIGGVVTIVILLLMTIGNHQGHIEDYFLIATALTIALALLGDWLLRKNGLKSD